MWKPIERCRETKHKRSHEGLEFAWYVPLFLAGVAFIFVSSGCGRIGFELSADEERERPRENDAGGEERNDARTDADTGPGTNIDANVDSSIDASSTMDVRDESIEHDACEDAEETDATPPSDAASDASANACVLSGETYEDGEAAALSGTLVITAVHSGKCASIENDSRDWGALVVQQNCDYSLAQLWEPLDQGEGWFMLRSPVSGHCLEPNDGNTSEGIEVGQWDCDLIDTQQYQAVCAGNDQWRIVNRASVLSLTVENASTSDGASFTGRTDEEEANQRFQIESQADVFEPIVPTAEYGSGAVWRYWTGAQPVGWTEEGFDDSGWAQGSAGFGQGSSRVIIGTPWYTSDIWLRNSFDLASPLPSDASLRINHDEGAEVYINGVMAFSTTEWISGYLQAELDSSANAALHVGTNIIAVHCRNTISSQYIDVGFGSYAWNPN